MPAGGTLRQFGIVILAAALLISAAPALSQSMQNHGDCSAESAAYESARANFEEAEAAAARAAEALRRAEAALEEARRRAAEARNAWDAAGGLACHRLGSCDGIADLLAAIYAADGAVQSAEMSLAAAQMTARRAAAAQTVPGILAMGAMRDAEDCERQRQAEAGDGGGSSGGAVAAIGAAALLGGVVWWLWPDGEDGAQTLQPFIAADNHGGRSFGMSAQLGARNSVHLLPGARPRRPG